MKKVLSVGIFLLLFTMPGGFLSAESAPTCSLSFTPKTITLGKTVTQSLKTTGFITSASFEGTGFLSFSDTYSGDEYSYFFNLLKSGKSFSEEIKPDKIGETSATYTVTGPGGSSNCTASFTTIPKSISKDSTQNTSSEGLPNLIETKYNNFQDTPEKQEIIPSVSENQPSNGKTIFINNKIIYLIIIGFSILVLFIVFRFLKSKFPSIKRKWLIIVLIILASVASIGGASYFGIKQYQNYQAKQIEKEKQIQELAKVQQEKEAKIQEEKEKQDSEVATLKKEVEALKSKTTKQTQNQQQADNKIAELKNELKSTDALVNENYDEQSNVVLDSIAKVVCFLNKNTTISGSGSVWVVGDDYYLVTNKHVLEEADREDESCAISIARDWNAVADDVEKAYQDDNLLIYNLELNYTYWEIDGFDFAITKIIADKQPLSFLDGIAMETNETECHENLRVGEKIKIIGFPYTSSVALPTITEGIISSFENVGDTKYYITSAKIEHGNSGGIAVTNNYYCMIGIPTAVVVGDSESLGRILILTEKDLKNFFDNI